MRDPTGLQASIRNALSAVVVCGLLSGCATTPSAIQNLPELPAEFAKDLALASTAPVLMTKSATTAPTLPPSPPGQVFLIARACTAIYEGYVIYPITVCYPPPELYEKLAVGAVEAPATGEFCVCCSGIMCPDGTCKLNPQQCGLTPPPAVK